MSERILAYLSDLKEGTTQVFELEKDGKKIQGFLANYQGKIVAYINECRHIPVGLDYDDQRFFTKDKKFFICQTHGAIYEPTTGLCVRGPCRGEYLKPVSIKIAGNKIRLAEKSDPHIRNQLREDETDD